MTVINGEETKAETEENVKMSRKWEYVCWINPHWRSEIWHVCWSFTTSDWLVIYRVWASPISSLQPSISSCRVSSRFSFRHCSAWICSFRNRISAFSFSSMWSADVRNATRSSRKRSTRPCSSWGRMKLHYRHQSVESSSSQFGEDKAQRKRH